MFRMCASNSHSYTHLILALGIVREPTVWVFITSKYPGTHDIGLPTLRGCAAVCLGGVIIAGVVGEGVAGERWHRVRGGGVFRIVRCFVAYVCTQTLRLPDNARRAKGVLPL